MAELLLQDDWAQPGPLAVHLLDALPDEYLVVMEPTVHGTQLDALVVGPRGLVVLWAKDWAGEIHPSRHGPWQVSSAGGQRVHQPNPAVEARQAEKAVRAFLADEFPALRPPIRQLLVLTEPGAKLINSEGTEPTVVILETTGPAIASMALADDRALADEQVRQSLALAFRDRRLTATQRASEPFVFRSGGLFGSGKKVWTIQAAVRHMDRHPQDGILHLHNGTLARWLSDQGAEHLAQQAREAVEHRRVDDRIPLETFLIGTGLVRRPRIALRPRQVDLGFVLSSGTRARRFTVKKGRGRGYLFGSMHTSEPWLRVEPRSFAGHARRSVVIADTETLPISRKPWRSEILVESSASPEPLSVPVQLRVAGMPSRLNRFFFRPLVGALVAGLLGAALGWALGSFGLGAPDWFGGVDAIPTGWPVTLAILVGLFWAVLGGLRGWYQRPAWPISFATGNWLVHTLIWGLVLAMLAVAAHLAWRRVGDGLGSSLAVSTLATAILLALALAVLPAALGAIGAARRSGHGSMRPARQSPLRPMLFAAAGVVLVLLVVAGALLVGPAWQQLDMETKTASAEDQLGEGWTQGQVELNNLVDRLIIRYYDRGNAVQGQTGSGLVEQVLGTFSRRGQVPTAVPRPTPTAGSGVP